MVGKQKRHQLVGCADFVQPCACGSMTSSPDQGCVGPSPQVTVAAGQLAWRVTCRCAVSASLCRCRRCTAPRCNLRPPGRRPGMPPEHALAVFHVEGLRLHSRRRRRTAVCAGVPTVHAERARELTVSWAFLDSGFRPHDRAASPQPAPPPPQKHRVVRGEGEIEQ